MKFFTEISQKHFKNSVFVILLPGRTKGCNNLTLSTLSDGTDQVVSPSSSSEEATPRSSLQSDYGESIDRSTYIVVKKVCAILFYDPLIFPLGQEICKYILVPG